jgi:hypothetical protein
MSRLPSWASYKRRRNAHEAWGLRPSPKRQAKRQTKRLVLTDAGLYAIGFVITCLLVGIGYVVFGMALAVWH